MLEQIKQAIGEFNALNIRTKELLTESNALYKQLDKLRMDLYTFHCKLDSIVAKNDIEGTSEEVANLLEDICDFGAAIKETEEVYRETRKEYSRTWPKADLAKKKVEKLKKKFWEQEGLAL